MRNWVSVLAVLTALLCSLRSPAWEPESGTASAADMATLFPAGVPSPARPETKRIPGDFNGDGRVDLEDLLLLLEEWGTAYTLKDFLDLLDNLGRIAKGAGENEGAFVNVPAGVFRLGGPYSDEGWSNERPAHDVYLDAYAIGKYPVTNREYADVLNWAHARGYLRNSSGGIYTGGEVYAHGQPLANTAAGSDSSQIVFESGVFSVRSRPGHNGVLYPMDEHPMVEVTWYGSVAYCNWLSEMHGRQPVYDPTTWTRYSPLRNGYRLPTEAEWEYAAAWDTTIPGGYHWRYGVSSDTLDFSRANSWQSEAANPLRLTTYPYTSPVGWYNGVNPQRVDEPAVLTVNSRSPVGAYDMAGNVWEWCHDGYSHYQYRRNAAEGLASNPSGLDSGLARVMRGGSWFTFGDSTARAADRGGGGPESRGSGLGFRLCVSGVAGS